MANPATNGNTSYPASVDTADTFSSTDYRSTINLANWLSRFWAAIIALQTKVGVDGSAVNTTLDFKTSGIADGDKAMSLTGVETGTNKTFIAPVINSPTGIVKGDVGLGNVDNTSDANKPVSSAQQTALNLKANLASPAFTGTPTFAGAINEAQGTNIASATTTNIGAATGNYVNVTGTTTITGLGTVAAGTRRIVNFSGALILTYNATSLILPTAANITTQAGDVAQFVSLGSGNWKCVSYIRNDGTALASSGGGSGKTGSQSIVASVTGTTVIAHGLGRAPVAVDFDYISTTFAVAIGFGSWSSGTGAGGAIFNGAAMTTTSGAIIVGDTPSSTYNTGAISVDATNITITWTKTGSPSSTWHVVWSAR